MTEAADSDVVFTAAILHDIGYTVINENDHEKNSGIMCKQYLIENGYNEEFIRKVVYIVENHSQKKLLSEPDINIEYAILMEADLLDETRAMAILWDCMDEGSSAEQSYSKTLDRLKSRSMYKYPGRNPMHTTTAKQLWKEKQKLFIDFIESLDYDIG
jgi:uncharacterized protein